jgi:sugar phosphate isomerase/epimerase
MANITLKRRDFLGSALAIGAIAAGLDDTAYAFQNSDIRYGFSGQAWMGESPDGKGWAGNIEEGIREVGRVGLDGIEPFRNHIVKYLNNPAALKRQLDDAGIAMLSCSNGGPGIETNFIDPVRSKKAVADHVAFARDFIKYFGCTAFKFNMGGRPPHKVMTEVQLKTLADSLNELGKQTIEFGIRAAPHPHLWGPMEREHELRYVLDNTDPRFVWFTPDTSHLTLCGMDPLKIMSEYFNRIAEIHYKDCLPKYRGNKISPTREEHRVRNLYEDLGAGGVDLKAIHRLVLAKRYKGWISLDYDSPRKGDGSGTLEENVMRNRDYLVNVLGVKTLKPPVLGKSACEFFCTPSKG